MDTKQADDLVVQKLQRALNLRDNPLSKRMGTLVQMAVQNHNTPFSRVDLANFIDQPNSLKAVKDYFLRRPDLGLWFRSEVRAPSFGGASFPQYKFFITPHAKQGRPCKRKEEAFA